MGKKVFISHSSKDQAYATIFVELLKNFGFREKDIFCSSMYATGVKYGEKIFERLKDELTDGPIMLYLLSQNYYESVVCLNEMGASWMMSEKHYPVALPHFDVGKIVGALGSDQLSLIAGDQFKAEDLFYLVEEISSSADVSWPGSVKLQPIMYIKPIQEQMNEALLESESLRPVEDDDLFETVLGEKRDVMGANKGKVYCYKLPKNILPEYLKPLDDIETTEKKQFLFIWTTQGEFEEGDKVRFRLKASEQKDFRDVGVCRNVYVDFIESV
ncbi:toll/interleukin-1 receptor domain-containing protein [Enterococcus sp. AZ072]|uniref:toll/interleukin-1 receptor domain-containing protein n=1 Tax=unclassified Enterococcus TaxID=2608891 RepID=UPI003D28BB05